MKFSNFLCGALVAGIFASPCCVSVPATGQKPVLGTHVGDWRDEVIYQILIDRFANGDINNDYNVRPGALARFQGGDWRGVSDHLDYIKELGVTTLWISPIVKNVETDADVDSYHGYWAQDLTKLNPHFGDISDLRAMIAHAHEMNIKVVLDIVTNHMGQMFYYDMNLNGHADNNVGGSGPLPVVASRSDVTHIGEYDPDWDPRGVQAFTSLGPAGRAPIIFIDDPSINRIAPAGILGTAAAYHGRGRVLNYDDHDQLTLGDFPGGLKDVATENQAVRDEMVDKYTRWVEEIDLDGFRIDTVKHVEYSFWTDFATRVRQRLAPQGKNRFLMFGEAFDGNDTLLGSFTQPNMLDSVFYFSQHYSVYRDVFTQAIDPTQQKGTKQIQDLWDQKTVHYNNTPQPGGVGVAPSKLNVNFMDNHDVERFLFAAKDDKVLLRNALVLLMMEEGIPCLYYGTEQDFNGGNDPANRENLWNTGYATTGDTFVHFKKLARIRATYPAFRQGDAKVVWSSEHVANEDDAGIFAFERGGGDAAGAYGLVVMNTNNFKDSITGDGSVSMTVNVKAGTQLVDVLDPDQTTYPVSAGGTLRLTVTKQSSMILVPEDQVKN